MSIIFKPKVLTQVLAQANTDNVLSTMLVELFKCPVFVAPLLIRRDLSVIDDCVLYLQL